MKNHRLQGNQQTNGARRLALLMSLVLALSCAPLALAEQPEKAAAQPEPAVETVDRLPSQSAALSVDEAIVLGHSYNDKQEYDKALGYFRQAAEQGDALGCAWVGFYYENGFSVEKDETQAREWYEKSAALGNGFGAYARGMIAYNQKDYETAVTYLTRAVECQYTLAGTTLGWMYLVGQGVEIDYQKAKEFYLVAANGGDAEAMHRLGEVYENHLPDVEQHERIAMSWYQQSALLGNYDAMYHMGTLCQKGIAVTKDAAKAEEWYLKALDKSGENAAYALYTLYCDNGERDKQKAGELFERLRARYQARIDEGEVQACVDMAQLYNNELLYGDYAKALERFEQAAALGSEDSFVYDSIGHLYTNHADAIPVDYEKCAAAYQKAIELGSGYAMYYTGRMYQEGRYYEKDEQKAEECFEKAREMGYVLP